MKKGMVGSMSEWSGLLKDFFRQVDDGSIAREMFKDFLEHKNPLAVSDAASGSRNRLNGIPLGFNGVLPLAYLRALQMRVNGFDIITEPFFCETLLNNVKHFQV